MAGVPFETLERLSTRRTAAIARELLVAQNEFAKSKLLVEQVRRSRIRGLSAEAFREMRSAHSGGQIPAGIATREGPEFTAQADVAAKVATLESQLQESLEREVETARAALVASARIVLAPYLVFSGGGVRELLTKLLTESAPEDALPRRSARAGDRERHLLLYLQRICAKNDTFSEFGPSAWGMVSQKSDGVELTVDPGIAKRECFLERWTAHAVVAALNRDPAIRIELSPSVAPNGRIDGDHFVFTDTGEKTPIDSYTVSILASCNGQTPAHSLGVETTELEQLAERNFLRWEVEVQTLDPHPFDTLISDVSKWRPGPVRTKWLEALQPIAALPAKFAQTNDIASRIASMDEARQLLDNLGVPHRPSERFLYAASNSIGEDCFRQCTLTISETMAEELMRETEPWIDLWRDSYAFVGARVAAGLRILFLSAPSENGAVPLPAFLRHCATQKIPLTGYGIVALAHMAFQEIKSAFRKVVGAREEAAEWILTTDDCHFVRKNFNYPKFDEYTFPSADLQILAASIEDVIRSDYEWILAELHPPIALLQHCMYWSCPDKPALSRALQSTTFGQPNFYYGFFAADFTAHTTVRQMDALPELTNFVAARRGNPEWRVIPPSETEVFINEENGDVCLRKRGSHEYLGSFARYWIIPLGFHPFFFGRAPHMPRLRCGKVIVQRHSWTVLRDELSGGNFTGISRNLVLAIERLRAQRDLPRFVYIRPTEQALRRSGAEGRDKDTKPVFIDLESYLFLEIFYRWLTKAGELEVTEMLPDPDHLLWQEADGRRTFELRTLIVPR